MKTNYLIVGSGLTGSIITRLLHDAGRQVVVLERRPIVGGNIADETLPSGIRVGLHGPHYFRTSSQKIWDFVQRFATWYSFEARLVAQTSPAGPFHPWPIQKTWTDIDIEYPYAHDNFEETCLSRMPEAKYKDFIRGYTRKQWGVEPRTLSAELAKRIPIRDDGDTRLSTHKFQALPLDGYSAFAQNLLSDIEVHHQNFLPEKISPNNSKIVFTGPIDELFGFRLGRLAYRAQKRSTNYFTNDYWRTMPHHQINLCHADYERAIRILNWVKMMPPDFPVPEYIPVTREYPYSPRCPDAYEYPFPDETNQALYRQYRALANDIPNLIVCGRLGEYKYLDMDQAIGRAMKIAQRLLETES